jgi:hypothetical protein
MVKSGKLVEIQILDKPNGNGRIYPRSVVESAITDKPVRGMIGMPNVSDDGIILDLKIHSINAVLDGA